MPLVFLSMKPISKSFLRRRAVCSLVLSIRSLIAGTDGTLYAGTEGSGLVYRIRSGGRMQVLYDAPEREVRALAVSESGRVYAGAMSGASRLEQGEGVQKRPEKAGPAQGEASSVYRISPSGAASKLWESTQPLLLSLLLGRDGGLLVATGDRGPASATAKLTPRAGSDIH